MTTAEKRRRARMRKAVELRQQGYSVRAIANHLEVTHPTVMGDLARWAEESSKTVKLPGSNLPSDGRNLPLESTDDNVLRLPRRKAQ